MDGRLCSIIWTPHTYVWRTVVVSRRIYRILWVKCTTSAERKTIRIAESSVMDGWTGYCLTQCQVLVLQKCFQKNGGRCRTEYSEGTAVAWLWFGVLAGYCRRNGDGHVWLTWSCKGRWSCLIDHRLSPLKRKWVPPFLQILIKRFSKCFR
jgi:hypothetical protein